MFCQKNTHNLDKYNVTKKPQNIPGLNFNSAINYCLKHNPRRKNDKSNDLKKMIQ